VKAAVMYEPGGPDVLSYEDVPDPVPQVGEVLIAVRAIGVQGGDVLSRASVVPEQVPYVVGYQVAGVVVGLGASVTDLVEGQRVAAFMSAGSHAELVCVGVAAVWPLPETLSFEAGAAVPVEFGTAHDSLFEFGGLQAGETVLVQAGASGVGLAAVQLAKTAGARVITTASSAERLQRLCDLGADHGLDYRDDVAASVSDLTDGRGADLVLDPVGGQALMVSLRSARYRGRVAFLGVVGRDATPPDLMLVLQKSLTLQGVFFGAEMARDETRTSPLILSIMDRVAAGELRAVIDRTYALSEAAAAHRYIESRASFGRVLLIP
jgi:NADPH2:quinone reductase